MTLTEDQKLRYVTFLELKKEFDELADEFSTELVQDDCNCEDEIEEYIWTIYPEGATEYTICLNCGGCCAGSEGYFS